MNRICLFACVAAAAFVRVAVASDLSVRGEALFTGKEPLAGAIRGHRSGLPPETVTCANCHASHNQPHPPSPAPPIRPSLLLQKVGRRGGPPSSYDPASFCKLLRTGVDPAYILIARVMPVYQVDDAQCAALWEFLTAEGGK